MTGFNSVLRSMVENVSSPTLLMRHVMRLVSGATVRHDTLSDPVVVGAFAAPAAPDMPLIFVTSRAVIAMIESFLRSIIVFSLTAPST